MALTLPLQKSALPIAIFAAIDRSSASALPTVEEVGEALGQPKDLLTTVAELEGAEVIRRQGDGLENTERSLDILGRAREVAPRPSPGEAPRAFDDDGLVWPNAIGVACAFLLVPGPSTNRFLADAIFPGRVYAQGRTQSRDAAQGGLRGLEKTGLAVPMSAADAAGLGAIYDEAKAGVARRDFKPTFWELTAKGRSNNLGLGYVFHEGRLPTGARN